MSWASILAGATKTVLGRSAGHGVFLRGEEITAHVIEGVEIIGEYGQVVGLRTEVVINATDAPQDGDALVIGGALVDDVLTGGTSYTLDAKVSDSGFSQHWVLVKA
jgi:hypothetical protein